jgi:hypothetical protein
MFLFARTLGKTDYFLHYLSICENILEISQLWLVEDQQEDKLMPSISIWIPKNHEILISDRLKETDCFETFVPM